MIEAAPFHDRPVFPRGFRCASTLCGLKSEGKDLALFHSDVPAQAAAVFTTNRFPGAPVIVGRELIRGGILRAVVVNSKVSNVATGDEGIRDARRMGAAAAAELGVPAEQVLMSSTGVIGKRLPVEKIEAGLRGLSARLQDDPLVGAEGIMTTDTYPKALSLSVGAATITVVAKGSGMIEPNMATMLVYTFTDADLPAAALDAMLRDAVGDTFNMLSVDSDTSTSDSCVILANGLAGAVDEEAFGRALRAAFLRVTEMLARDGEGATKLLRATVEEARDAAEARRVAKAIINSPLVKTMAFGADPNIGRVLMAVGKSVERDLDATAVRVWIQEMEVVSGGVRGEYDDAEVRALLAKDPVDIRVALGSGDARATAYGCDLTHGYIEENAAYYST